MKKQVWVSFACSLIIVMWTLACAPPPPPMRTIYTSITSQPPGAKITFGTSKDAISSYLGVTPYSNSNTGQYPYWNAGYYRAERKGYMPQTKHTEATYGDLNIIFEMAPLPKFPNPPKVVYPDPESVAIKPLSLDIPEVNSFRMDSESKIATMTFKQHEGSGAGALVADSLILNLQRMGFNVIDREMIESVLKEQDIIAEGKTTLSDLEVSKKIGQLFHADYFISGAITEYSAQSQNVYLSPLIPEDEKTRYVEEYDRYVKFYQDEEMTLPQVPKSIQEWELEYTSKPKSSFINIARVGITLKVVDIKTSRIVWVGIAHTSDLRLQEGMKRIVDGMIKSFTTARKPATIKDPAEQPVPLPAADEPPAAAAVTDKPAAGQTDAPASIPQDNSVPAQAPVKEAEPAVKEEPAPPASPPETK